MGTMIPARDIEPGMKYRERVIFSVMRSVDGKVRIVVVCPPHLPRIGIDHPVYGPTGKFEFDGEEMVEING